MAYDWSALLGDIESFTVRRAKSLLDEEDERRRRRRVAGSAAREDEGERERRGPRNAVPHEPSQGHSSRRF